ncbi:MAG: type II secretion system F family protein [Deltaproteobacteria bacterium]|nr:type II secretion system F family protein [Deltaproteobacteria bacterium]
MPEFTWSARARNGETKSGTIEAANADVVIQRLKGMNLVEPKVKKKAEPLSFKLPGSTGIPTKSIVVFTRQFATMIDAGLPLVQCLDILAKQQELPPFKKVLVAIKGDVESGKTFADSLSRHPKTFDPLYVNLVAAGEVGGILDTIMNRLATQLEKTEKLRRQVKGALTYPAVTLGVTAVCTYILLIYVIPVFGKMFTEMGKALPALTQWVIDLSNWTQENVVFVVGVPVALGVGINTFRKTPQGREFFDRLFLLLPVLGDTIRKVAVARFTRTMGTMLTSGVPILDALDIVAKAAGNVVISGALLTVKEKISQGKTMAEPLKETQVFPSMVVQMIEVGESTGALDTMLNKIADFYEEEVDEAIRGLTALLEPLIMMVIAVVIGGLVISMYLPVFSLAGALGGD